MYYSHNNSIKCVDSTIKCIDSTIKFIDFESIHYAINLDFIAILDSMFLSIFC